jgi:hypothetical protein
LTSRSAARTTLVLSAGLLAACASDNPPPQDFTSFWRQFTSAVAANDESGVRSLTSFPFLYESEERDSTGFDAIWSGLFDAGARECLSHAQPAAEGDAYQVQCGAIVYVFGRDGDAWRFTDFTADPEALEGADDAGPGPGDVVQQMLDEHMAGDMAFTPQLVAPKRRFLTPELNAAIDAYFARPVPDDEPPPINGDPFTNSQEYPRGFRIAAVGEDETTASVDIVFTHEGADRPMSVLLRRTAEGWRIDDLRYEDGTTLRELLAGG